MSSRVRVLIADDDARVQQDFQTIIDLESDMDVVGVTGDGVTTVEACRLHHPDVVVMDVRMPRLDGIAATRLVKSDPDLTCNVLVMTTFDLDDYVLGAIRAGASGFMLKDQATELLAPAVRTVAAGDGIVSPRATALLLRQFAPRRQSSADSLLTRREREVIALLARGCTNEEIAAAAFITLATVKTHVSSILSKLNVKNRIQIAVWAYEHGCTPHGGWRDDGRSW